MNCDYQLDLSDALKVFRISVASIGENSWCSADVDGDGKVYLPEGIFVLQAISGHHRPLDSAYFPITAGNTWQYRHTDTSPGSSAAASTITFYCIGETLVDGNSVMVLKSTSSQGSEDTYEQYYQVTSEGILDWGNTSSDDFITPQIKPLHEIPFPVVPGDTWTIVDKKNILWEDLDFDGVKEPTQTSSQGLFIGYESVNVATGTFNACVHLQFVMSFSITLTSLGSTVTGNEKQDMWLYPGVGPVKQTSSVTATGPAGAVQESFEEELIRFRVSGLGKDSTSPIIIADHLAPSDSDTETPGSPGIGTNGQERLAVTYRKAGLTSGLIGIMIKGDMSLYKEFPIASFKGNFPNPEVSFDGENYLVVFQKDGVIRGIRITSSGHVLDPDGGFAISTGSSNWHPAIAYDGSKYLVVWNKFSNTTGHDIYGAIVMADGQVQDEFPICNKDREQSSSALAFDGTNFFVVWKDYRNGASPDYFPDIYGTRVSAQVGVLDKEGVPIATSSTYQEAPQIVFDGNNYFVAWQDIPQIGFSPPVSSIHAKRISPEGTLLDGSPANNGIAVNTMEIGKTYLTLAFDGQHYKVAWVVDAYNNQLPAGIYSARISTDGTLLDGPADSLGQMIVGPPPDYSKIVHPVLSFNGNSTIIGWVINSEMSGTGKSMGALILPP